MENAQILELLKNDNEYYNGIGRNYLSNSDIGTLLNNPKMFGKKSEPSLAAQILSWPSEFATRYSHSSKACIHWTADTR